MASPSDSARQGTNITSAGTSHAINVGSPSAGTLLIVFVRFAAAPGTVTFTGYTPFVGPDTSDAADDTTTIFYRWADGTEGATDTLATANSVKLGAICWEITGAANPSIQPPVAGTVQNFTTAANSANPTSVAPGAGNRDFLILAVAGHDGEVGAYTAFPTNYANLTTANSGTGGNANTNVIMGGASRALTAAASEDPGAFTHGAATTGGSAWAIAIFPTITLLSPAGLAQTRAQGDIRTSPGVLPAGLARTRALGSTVVQPHHRTRALGALTVSTGTTLSPASLSRTRVQGTPAVSPQVLPSGLARSRAQGDPSVSSVTALSPASLERSRAQGTPVVSPTILPSGLARSRAQGDPTVSTDITLSPASLTHTRAQGTPVVSPTLLPSGLARSRAQGSPALYDTHRVRALGALTVSVGTQLSPASLVRTRAQGDPTVSTPTILSPSSLVSGIPEIPLLLGSFNRERALGSPTASEAGGATTLSPASLERTRAQGAPVVNVSTGTTGLERTRALGTPVVSPQLLPESLVRTRALGTFVLPPSVAGLAHTRALGTPTIHPSVLPASLVRSRALGAPTDGSVVPGTHLMLLRGVG